MPSRANLVAALCVSACGLERDWDRWQVAALSWTEYSSTGGSTSTAPAEASSEASSAGSTRADTTDAGEASGDASTSTGATTDTTDDESSTGLAPICGDGHVDADLGEECDDESDLCVGCRRSRLIFVTSTFLQGNMNGLVGADAYCKSLANTAKLELPDSPIVDPGNFKALLTTSTETISERHFAGEGPYRLINGLPVSDSFAQLFSEPLHNPINVDQRSQTVIAPVWTGTDVDGSPYPAIDFCGDWKDLYGIANVGSSDAVDSWWIHIDVDLNPTTDCLDELPIYCVEQE